MKPQDYIEKAKRDVHEKLLVHDDDYRFECACCGESVTYDKYSWFELRERLDRFKMPDFRSRVAQAMVYSEAAEIDNEIYTKLLKEGP